MLKPGVFTAPGALPKQPWSPDGVGIGMVAWLGVCNPSPGLWEPGES